MTTSGCQNVSQCHLKRPSQDNTHPDDQNIRTYNMTTGFKPFTRIYNIGKFQVFNTSTLVTCIPYHLEN